MSRLTLPFLWLALLPCLALGACATPQTDFVRQHREQFPGRTEISGVPFFPQEKYYCGPAALAMMLAWSGLSATQEDMAKQVYTPGRAGTLQNDILTAIRRNGRLALSIDSLPDLITEISEGHPVLVFQNLAFDWYPKWHYAVAFGYDLDAGTLLLHSGLEAREVIDLIAFERTWRRAGYWAVVVLPPDQLPVAANERTAIEAATNLMRVNRHAEAAVAFLTITKRWPRSFVAYIGLGNARYALSEWSQAEQAYRAAITISPGTASAWNNLAYALAKQERRNEAIDAARKALVLDDTNAEIYRDTLKEMSAAGEP